MRFRSAVLLALLISCSAFGQNYTISTFAGGGLPVGIPGTSAHLLGPYGLAVDPAGNVFFADGGNVVLRMDAKTAVLTLVAGNGTQGFSGDDGLATNAQLALPAGAAMDAAGNLYIADCLNTRARKVSHGVITTFAGGDFTGGYATPTSPQLLCPDAVAVDAANNLFIVEQGTNSIRKISNGAITTVAGGGLAGYNGDNIPATNAELNYPTGIALDAVGNLYIADQLNNRIRKVSNGVITTVAGNGTAGYNGDNIPATSSELNNPYGVAVDAVGNLYIADSGNNRIRMVSGGVITTVEGNGTQGLSGDNGPATSAQLNDPLAVVLDTVGNLYIGDTGNGRIRKVAGGVITTVAGGGILLGNNTPALGAQLNYSNGVATDSAGNLYVNDSNNSLIRKITNGVITTVAGNGTLGYSGDNGPATLAQLNYPSAVAVDPVGNLYIADTQNQRIRKVSGGVITTVAGNGSTCCVENMGNIGDNGPATSAPLNSPFGVAVDAAGNLYIADTRNLRIRKVSGGVITTVVGNGEWGYGGDNGPATTAQLTGPGGVAVDATGNLYIADGGVVRKVSNGIITTVAGSQTNGLGCPPVLGSSLSVSTAPSGIAVDSGGNLYVSVGGGDCLMKVSGGVITTLSGTGSQGFSGDGGPAVLAELSGPTGVAVDRAGEIYVAEPLSNRIRILTPGTPPAITPGGIVPNDGDVSAIQTGSWISIFGSDLAGGTSLWNGDFPQSLGGTSVTIDNRSAYLWFVSPQQINLQVPDDAATGVVEVTVSTASGSASSTVTLATYAPSFSLLGDGVHVAGEIATPDGSGAYGAGTYDLVGPSNTFSFNTRPAKAGETLILYGVGFGPTTPVALAGQPFSGAARTNSPVTVTIGGVSAPVTFAGISEAGLYQLNLTVPANTGSGDLALQATVNGIQTPLGPVVTVQ
jgi:uncharacterized protein (TIGR03437 family)